MFEYELQQIRSAEMIREAEHYRQVREARRARREAAHDSGTAARSASGEGDTDAERPVLGERIRRLRFPRAA
ncbi:MULTISPECIES: hypothetical protein [Streptomyces]|uniref:Uncharacterized protein n=1 Tax=Streptomyces stelliscabiei TaxID=146820 RepID=A0A8I0TWK2_9ACTN|nr:MULTISPECIES: hypothetical protein [Streptomyces]KND42416.1 hypothetical protein IQ64_23870 [Streptomyces stelliscabiei]MBE1600443.1 hypothetical protein [Streptomyces stelliscabiei]MDX2518259.1 hypothetical protein [Streptomyces stelliscabiei]MDX2554499.1 hypothetical protein [Streptomyces stelliscabiei]MDX2613708.1 hypothetical protein [Streptomyces stelliscabiei]